MWIVSLGSAGLGLVWGWSAVLLIGHNRARRPLRNLAWLAVATVLVSLQVFWFASWQGLAPFLGAGVLAIFIHLAWREDMRKRADSPCQPF